ncbi:MAG: FadR family transcriptional regulator [Clostridiales bacterium]|nr:FadR family transcriptional regulator [Clostridiales bacterium]
MQPDLTSNLLDLLQPVETQRASEVIYEQIRSLIISGKLQPGDRLPSERSMMEAFHRSRPTIREALRMLELADLVRIVPGTHGAVVQELTAAGVVRPLGILLRANKISPDDLEEYRLINDTVAARWAAVRRTKDDLQAMESILSRQKAETEAEHDAAILRCDLGFHTALSRAGRNQVALILTQALHEIIHEVMTQVYQQQSQEENCAMSQLILRQHREIFEAVKSEDPDAAEQAMKTHIHASRVTLRFFEQG